MGCGEFLVKYILFFANLGFALAGLALLGLGVASQIQLKVITDLNNTGYEFAPITCMVVGGVVFVIAFFGCCGAIRENNCMLVTFSIFMLMLMIIKLAFAILIFVRLDDVVDGVPSVMDQIFKTDQTGFHGIESALECCGTTGASSYAPNTIPPSCCAPATAQCDTNNSFQGCNEVFGALIRTFGLAIGIVAIVVVSIELVAAVFGLCLANHVRNKNRRTRY